jgi:hypothetical protein
MSLRLLLCVSLVPTSPPRRYVQLRRVAEGSSLRQCESGGIGRNAYSYSSRLGTSIGN